jgi:pimeloyl-ACP methyl ester carboxylesterase
MGLGEIASGQVEVGALEVGYLAAGEHGPLAICLHGFPDTAWTWRHLLPALAEAGYRAVAPFLRGYAPTSLAPDGNYQIGAIVDDAVRMHDVLGGAGDAVLIGHDWGALATYGAAAYAPDRWRRVVAASVPPFAVLGTAMLNYDQLRRSWYTFFFQSPLADVVVGANDLEFIARLWGDWSPGYDAAEDVAHVRDAIGDPERLAAAIGYYRAMFGNAVGDPELQAQQDATGAPTPQPLLYLHGAEDGCFGVEWAEPVAGHLSVAGSRSEIVAGAGHFVQLDQPAIVNQLILDFLAS